MSLFSAGKRTAQLYAAYALYTNVQLEYSSQVFEFGVAGAVLHTLLYVFRLAVTLVMQRVFRVLRAGKATDKWSLADELYIRAVHFSIKVGSTRTATALLDLGRDDELAKLKKAGKLHVEPLSPQQLGFGTNEAEARFGSLTCSAVWMTLDGKPKLGGSSPPPLVLFNVHGGGFCFGNWGMYLPAYHRLLEKMAKECGVTNVGMLSIDYPLAPEAKYPTPLDMCDFALTHLLRSGLLGGSRVVVIGDSAGGSMALNLAIHHKHELAGVGLISPWVGHALDKPSYEENKDVDLIGGNALIERFQNTSVQGGKRKCVQDDTLHVVDKQLPWGELLGNLPVWISCGEFEIFRDDILQFYNEVKQARTTTTTTLEFGKACIHDYPLCWPALRDQGGEAALSSCAKFCAVSTS